MKRWLFVLALVASPVLADNGILLVAKPTLVDPNFKETVVIVTRAQDGNTVGVVLNRPLSVHLADIAPNWPGAEKYAEPLYAGGPVMREVVVALFTADTPPEDAAFQVLPNIWLTLHPRLITRLLADPGNGPMRLFAGFAGWAPRQLEAEVDDGAWYALRASESVLFRKDTSSLWRELIEQASGGRAANDRELYWSHELRSARPLRHLAGCCRPARIRPGRGDDPGRASRVQGS
jgi:putative transcriptional regulator